MRMFLIAVAVALMAFVGVYFLSSAGYEVSVHKVTSKKQLELPMLKPRDEAKDLVKPQLPKPFLLPRNKVEQPVIAVSPAERDVHVAALQSIQRELGQLRKPSGGIDIDRLESTMNKFVALSKQAPELGIEKSVNVKKLQELVLALRKLDVLQKEMKFLTKDPKHINMPELNLKVAELQGLQRIVMDTLPYINPSAQYKK